MMRRDETRMRFICKRPPLNNGDVHPIEVERKAVVYQTPLPAEWISNEKEWLYEKPNELTSGTNKKSPSPEEEKTVENKDKTMSATEVEAKVSQILNEATAEAKSMVPAQLKPQLGLDNVPFICYFIGKMLIGIQFNNSPSFHQTPKSNSM